MKKLYFNGDIITMKSESDKCEALLVNDGKIECAGTLLEVQRYTDEDTKRINLDGKTLMPSFIDPHGHITMAAQFSTVADLSECESFNDIKEVLRKYIEDKNITKDDVVIGFGYDHNFLKEECHPNKFELDSVSDEIPIFVFHTSGHMGCVNTALLKIAGIDKSTPDPEGAKYGRCEGSSEPDGYIEEGQAIAGVLMSVYPRIKSDMVNNMKAAQKLYLKNGITTVQDGATGKDMLELLAMLDKNGMLDIDVVAYIMVNEPAEIMKDYIEFDNKYYKHFKVGGRKIVLDGSPQGKSAWLTKPYEGEKDYCAYPSMSNEQAWEYIKASVDDNKQLLAHCNGDAAGDQFIKGYEMALESSSNPNKNNLRPVMIHCQTARADQLDKMVELNMIPSIFIGHTYYWGDIHLKNLGIERGSHISPAASAFKRGLNVNFHQDPPVTKPNMLHSVWAGVNRITRGGVKIGQDECVSVFDALKAVTINGAYSYFEEETKGTLEVGKLADLVILDKNPLLTDKMEIKDIKVLETIKEGKTLYKVDVSLNTEANTSLI